MKTGARLRVGSVLISATGAAYMASEFGVPNSVIVLIALIGGAIGYEALSTRGKK